MNFVRPEYSSLGRLQHLTISWIMLYHLKNINWAEPVSGKNVNCASKYNI